VARTTEPVDPERSARMRLIKGRDTKPEMVVRRALHAAGLRYRLHVRDLPGQPDIVFRGRRIAILVHGCFWHQHPDPSCKLARMPKTRRDFWEPKLKGNRARDEANKLTLEGRGWRVIEIWECELNADGIARMTREVVDTVRDRVPTRTTRSKPSGRPGPGRG
jgi:DNA mismatch endonuclease, patch repair protein